MKIDVTIRGLAAGLGVSACLLLTACGTETAPTNNAAATNTAASTMSRNANTTSATSANAPAGGEGTPALQEAAREVDAALDKAGFTSLQVSIKSNTIQVKGTVPPGKLQEAQKVAREAAGMNATMMEIYQENPK